MIRTLTSFLALVLFLSACGDNRNSENGGNNGSPGPGGTIDDSGSRREAPVLSAAPDSGQVIESSVQHHVPLPSGTLPHPQACEWLRFLRFRHAQGPREAAQADAIFVAMPGLFGGASGFDQLARNIIQDGAARGLNIEFWAIDRRANCLEDRTGIDGAVAARDGRVALDYYWGGAEVNGRRFDGFKSAQETRWLEALGMEQTVRDWRAIIEAELPDPALRRRKLICGGHSLGGPVTAAFAAFDADGDATTLEDAGFMQCAGFFGLDTSFGGTPRGADLELLTLLGEVSQLQPYASIPGIIGPQFYQLLQVVGTAASVAPEATGLNAALPVTPDFELMLRALFTRDATTFVAGPGLRDFVMTNMALFGAFVDDNSQPIGLLRVSGGVSDGGAVAPKQFPTPAGLNVGAEGFGLLSNDFVVAPIEPQGPVYHWRHYLNIDETGTAFPVDNQGRRYSSGKNEVTDLAQYARMHHEAPADRNEQYFPTRLLVDFLAFMGAGPDSGSAFMHDGIAQRPALLIMAGDSAANTGPEPERGADTPPLTEPPQVGVVQTVTLPGYNHGDVATAAHVQNGGEPEWSSRTLLEFGLAALALQP